jgi:hypothetical protein
MIFLLAALILLAAWRFTLTARRQGLLLAVREVMLASASGLLAGVFIGLGARLGMSAITVANGSAPRFTLPGTVTVVVTFAGYGGIFGVVYAGLFRQLLRRRGAAYGLLLMLCSWYPLAHAGAQQLTNPPPAGALFFISGIVVAAMWVPYGVSLEMLVSRWQHQIAAPACVRPAA